MMETPAMMQYPKKLLCPCSNNSSNTPKLFSQCCARFIVQAALPESAVELMRSRYSAYVLEEETYLALTWHPSTRPSSPIIAVNDGVKWTGLVLLGHHQTGDSASVEFIAHYKIHGRAQQLHEISRFVREDQRWFYLDGSFPEKITKTIKG